jgi:hypothetical protein
MVLNQSDVSYICEGATPDQLKGQSNEIFAFDFSGMGSSHFGWKS